MKRLITAIALAAVVIPLGAQERRATTNTFASDFQTLPVVANVPGIGATFQSYVSILNPTASTYNITASFYDGNGTKKDATITLAAGEQKTYQNFLSEVFSASGGGAVTFRSVDSAGGQRNNRFIVNSEVRTSGTHFSTSIPALEFAGSSSRSFVPGISIDANTRTNVGCFNQSADSTNIVKVTVLDSTGKQTIGTQTLTLAPNAWGQIGITSSVTNGYAQFDPTDNAVCYAVVVDNTTADGRFASSAEYKP